MSWFLLGVLIWTAAGWRAGAAAGETEALLPELTNAVSVLRLTQEEADRGYPVRIQGTVTYYDPAWSLFFLQDETSGAYVFSARVAPELRQGDAIRVLGRSGGGRVSRIIVEPQVTVLGVGKLPEPKGVRIAEIAREDCQWVEVEATVRRGRALGPGYWQFDLVDETGRCSIIVQVKDASATPQSMIGALVRVRAVAAAVLDSQEEYVVGGRLFAAAPEQIEVVNPPASELESEIVPIKNLTSMQRVDHQQRYRITGLVTAVDNDRFYLQDGPAAALVEPLDGPAPNVGDVMMAAGFLNDRGMAPLLEDARVERVSTNGTPMPTSVAAANLVVQPFHGRLVRVEADFVMFEGRNGWPQVLCQDGPVVFEAFVKERRATATWSAIEPKSLLQLTGICLQTQNQRGDGYSFSLLLRSVEDLKVVRPPPWWAIPDMTEVLTTMGAVVALVLTWVLLLRLRLRTQTEQIRKRFEKEAEVESKYRQLFDRASDIVYTHDSSGKLMSFNPVAEKLTGYTHAEALRMSIFELVVPEHVETVRQQMQAKTSEEVSSTYEVALAKKHGGRVILEVSSWPIFDEGRAVAVQGIARDVTGRKREERRLTIIAGLSQKLSVASTVHDAARVLLDSAQELFGWEACSFDMYSDELKVNRPVLHIDTIEGKKLQVSSAYRNVPPSDFALRVMSEGAKLVLREPGEAATEGLKPFGSKDRRSASLMFVPIRNGPKVIGVISIQSYQHRAYNPEDLRAMQALADHCAGALERIRIEQTLQESEKLYRALIEKSCDGVALVNAEGTIRYASPGFARILRCGPGQAAGVNLFDQFHPDEASLAQDQIAQGLQSPNSTMNFEARCRRIDETWCWLDCSATNLLGEPGVNAIVINCRDTTERKLADHARQESEERFRLLFETSPLGISISRDGWILQANPAYAQMFGYAEARELAGKSELDQMAPKSRAEVMDRVRRTSSGEDVPLSCECSGITRAGIEFPVHAHLSRIHLPDGPATVVCLIDLTERVNLEVQLRHSQKMESVGQLAAGIAHDFNNILNIILGYTTILQESDNLTSEQNEALKQMFLAAERAGKLTRQLLTFSRKQVMQQAVLNLNEVVHQAARILQRVLGEQVRLQFNYAPSPPMVMGDLGMFEQMLMNLAVNARDAMPKGGLITISTSLLSIDDAYVGRNPEARLGSFVCLSVADTGCGIGMDIRPRIFDPFFTTKGVGQGTGLGLSTVYGIVKQHGGWIELETEPGEGAIFRIYLPATDRAPLAAAPPVASLPVKGGHETVLLVEDELPLLELARTVLDKYGYKVHEATNGVRALKVWAQHQDEIDILVTDMVMPEGISGRELAERLTAEKPGLKVIYSSGYSVEFLHPDLVLQEGFNFLQKPYRPQRLAETVRAMLDSNGDRQPN